MIRKLLCKLGILHTWQGFRGRKVYGDSGDIVFYCKYCGRRKNGESKWSKKHGI